MEGQPGQQFKVSNDSISGGYTIIESALCSGKTIQMRALGCDVANSVSLVSNDSGGFWNHETSSFDDFSERHWKMTPRKELVNEYCAKMQLPNVSLGIDGGIDGGTNRIVMRKPRKQSIFETLEEWSYRVDPSRD